MLQRRTLLAGMAAGTVTPAMMTLRAAARGSVALFVQPTFRNGIAPNFSVTGAVPAYNPVGAFYLHANQPNPYRHDSAFVPVAWDATTTTGLHVGGNAADWQRGIATPANPSGRGQTLAQVYGNAVGAFLDSRDLIHGSPGNRMMISPNFAFPTAVAPFASATGALGVALQLQVPTASDAHINGVSNTYAKADVLLICRATGARVSVSFGLFANQSFPQHDGIGFDDISKSVIIGALVSPLGQYATVQPGSATFQSVPWIGWRTFSVVMSRAQFAAGLIAAAPVAQRYGYKVYLNPADYVLSATHLNAELHFTRAKPATLGWSMRDLTVVALS